MTIAYPHIAERLFGRAHAIEPAALRVIIDGPIARRVLAGEKLEGKQAKRGRDLRRERLSALAGAESVRSGDGLIEYALTPQGVAIVSIAGVLSKRFDWLAAACGWTTYESLAATLDSAIGNLSVRAVLLDVDSPGGEADGMLDVGDMILSLRDKKPIWAVANSLAASAGYAIAGSAERLTLPRLGQVGSIGCVMIHVDQSVRDLASGLDYTAIYSGARKLDGWGHAPLGDDARAVAQSGVDHVRAEFAALVGRQGRMSAAAALATEAAVYHDDDAVQARFADAVGTFDDALTELVEQLAGDGTMTVKTQLKQNSSPAAVVAGVQSAPAKPAEPAAASAAAAAAAEPDDDEEMTPPKPGEKCELCGQIMPEQETKKESTAPEYSTDDITQTLELCTIARLPLAEARAFVAAKTPLPKVRAALAKRAADAAGDEIDSTLAPPSGKNEAAVAAAWDDIVDKQNKKLGLVGR